MNRVAVIGSGGAGKSTLARQLGDRTGLPVYCLDALNWKPGWVPTPPDEWRAIVEDLVKRDRWILDGNYGGTMDLRIAAADTVVFLDFSRWRCLWNWLKRVARWWGRTRPDMGPGCVERFDPDMPKWIWGFPARGRLAILDRLARLGGGKTIVTLRNPKEVRGYLRSLSTPTIPPC
ncbi:MAG: hypothetical protein AAB152_12105 [Candidatus Coatesbacteria bacterium]